MIFGWQFKHMRQENQILPLGSKIVWLLRTIGPSSLLRMRFKSTSDLCFFCVVADILLLPLWKLIKSGIFTSCSRKTTEKSLPINYPLLLIMAPLEEEKRKPASFMNGMGLHTLPTKESSAKLLRNRFGRRVQSASEKIKTTSLLILAKCWLFQEKKRYRFVYYQFQHFCLFYFKSKKTKT